MLKLHLATFTLWQRAGDRLKNAFVLPQGESMNLTDQQMELLHLLVLNHEAQGGAEFYFTQSRSGSGLSYVGGLRIPVAYDASDFEELRRERVITLTRIEKLSHRGKPTQLGITTVRRALLHRDDQALQQDAAPPAAELRPIAGPVAKVPTLPPSASTTQNSDTTAYAKGPLAETCKSFLSGFPPAIGAAVEAGEIRSERALAQASTGGNAPGEKLVDAHIMRVFLAFASALCKLGLKRQYEIRDIDPACRRFLQLFAASSYQEKLWQNRGALLRGALSGNFAEILARLERTAEWDQYRREFSAVEDKLLADLDQRASQLLEASDETGLETERSVMVREFLTRCNEEPGCPERIYKKHIWMAAGHTTARQFQHWQSSDGEATSENEKNFKRILALQTADFLILVRKMNLLSNK